MPRKPDRRQKFDISPKAHRKLRVEAARTGHTIGYILDRLILDLLEPGVIADRVNAEGELLEAGVKRKRKRKL